LLLLISPISSVVRTQPWILKTERGWWYTWVIMSLGNKNRGQIFVCIKTLGACRDERSVIFEIGGLNGVKKNAYDLTPK